MHAPRLSAWALVRLAMIRVKAFSTTCEKPQLRRARLLHLQYKWHAELRGRQFASCCGCE
jgi:hypothetical protein